MGSFVNRDRLGKSNVTKNGNHGLENEFGSKGEGVLRLNGL